MNYIKIHNDRITRVNAPKDIIQAQELEEEIKDICIPFKDYDEQGYHEFYKYCDGTVFRLYYTRKFGKILGIAVCFINNEFFGILW